jgi:Undecaprenyl-phosphate galactose phosphotransferase WbaP
MNNPQPVDTLTASVGLALPADGLTAELADTARILTDNPPGQTRVQLRGTRRSHKSVPRHGDGFRGKGRLPMPRQGGTFTYLRQLFFTGLPLVLTDLAVLGLAVIICSLLGLQWLNPADPTSTAAVWFPSVAVAWLLINYMLKLYPGIGLGLVDEIRRLTISLTVVAIITLVRQRPTSEWFYERAVFLSVAYCICVVLAPIARSVVRKTLARTSWWGFPTLVCGDDMAAFSVDRWLDDNRRLGLRPVGVIAEPHSMELDYDSPRFLGPWSEAREIAEQRHAYWAVAVEPEETEQIQLGMTSAIEKHLGNVPHIIVMSNLTGIPDGWNRHQMDEGLPGLLVEQHLLLPIPQLVKRGMDLAIATAAGILLLPLFIVLGVVIKLTSRGPIFYGHPRAGKGNSSFKAWKFRTMVADADAVLHDYLAKHPELQAEWERDQKLKNDPRVTGIGRWMRKWSVDELPQIWNVLRGEMSVVGPRPKPHPEVPLYGEHFQTISSVLPGITGLWQVCGRNDTTYEERIQLDMYYVHHWSPWLDLYLLVRTVKTVLFTRGAY